MSEPIFGNWMVAVAEAAEVAGAPDLDGASVEQMAKAWGLVRRTAGVTRGEMVSAMARQAGIPVAQLSERDARAETLLPAEVAHRRMVLPLACTGREVMVATANPLSQESRREIEWLTSRTVRFHVAHPRALGAQIIEAYGPAEGAEKAPPAEGGPTGPKGPHILVVDDEAGQRELFRSILEGEGYRVDVARDGPSAVESLMSDASYDLVTLDYWMDKMNGLRVLQQIRSGAGLQELPVIMVTAAEDRQIEMSLFEAGADDFIAKPIDGPLFLLRIRAVLRRRSFPTRTG